MTDEEKKAIEDLKELSYYCSLRALDIKDKNSDTWARYCVSTQKVENLIEKQQAEIEKEKEKNKILSIQIIENEKLYNKETARLGNLIRELLEERN